MNRTTISCLSVFIAMTFFVGAGAATAGKPVTIKSKSGVLCVVLPYDFDSTNEDFPKLDLPDNALLVLTGEDSSFKPERMTVTQDGVAYSPDGSIPIYQWGTFNAIFFPADFGKFKPFEVKVGDVSLAITADMIAGLVGGAKPRGKRSWRDPITDVAIRNASPVELPELVARGGAMDYMNEALTLRGDGGLAAVRAAAIRAFDSKEYLRAAVLSGEVIKWSKGLEPPDIRPSLNFLDWALMARAFMAMDMALPAVIAYDEALKLRKDKVVEAEREKAWKAYGKKGAAAAPTAEAEPFHDGMFESEIASMKRGPLPIPPSERGVIREGLSADGVFLGDYRDRIVAQCGAPTESFSGMILYRDHPTCPETIYFTPDGRAYLIHSLRGKTQKGISVGDKLINTQDAYGAPDRKESETIEGAKKASVRWVYLRSKVAFGDLDGDGAIDSIEVFNYSLNR